MVKRGIRVKFVESPNPDTTDPISMLIFTVLSAFDEYFVSNTVKASRAGKYQAVSDGNVIASRATYGYTLSGEKGNRRLEIDQYSADIVRELFRLYAEEDYSLEQLVKHCAEKGYPTSSEYYKIKRPEGKEGTKAAWTRTTMRRVLSNPTYTGVWEFGNIQAEGYEQKDIATAAVPPIIGQPLFDTVQKRLVTNQKNKRAESALAHPLLAHMKCFHCEGSYRRRVDKKKDGSVRIGYYCGNARRGGECKPNLQDPDGLGAEQKISHEVIWTIQSPEHVAEVLADMETDADSVNAPVYARIEAIETQLQKAIAAKDKLVDLHVEGILSKSELGDKLSGRDRNIAKLEDQLSEVKNQLVLTPGIDIEVLREYWQAGSFEIIRNLLGEDKESGGLRWPVTKEGNIDTSDVTQLPQDLLKKLYDLVDLRVLVEGKGPEKDYHVHTNLDSVVSNARGIVPGARLCDSNRQDLHIGL